MNGKTGFRIGQGLDVHAFGPGDHVLICGVSIPHEFGLQAHSDGDVALHAVCDALLGAAGLGDIGRHFPDQDMDWASADSRELLNRVMELLRQAGWAVNNADLTVVCEAPRLAPHVGAMRGILAAELGIDVSAASVKATSTERLGFCGRGEGIAALAVVSLVAAE
jgi:2-C-methyl-D-erythritol 2,4-cyclodiphosphate synthase